MPLRPVSELGLVDITDVPARAGNRTEARRHSTHTSRSPKQPVRSDAPNDDQKATRSDRSKRAPAPPQRNTDADASRASKNLARAPERQGARGPRRAPSTRSGHSKVASTQARPSTKPRRASASTTTSSERSRSTSKAATDTRSGAAARTATTRTPKRSPGSTRRPQGVTRVRRQTAITPRTKANPASRETQRSRNARTLDQTKLPSAAKIGVSVLMTAGLVAAGLVFARAALQR